MSKTNKIKAYFYTDNAPHTGNEIHNLLMPVTYTETLNGEIDTMELSYIDSNKDAVLPSTRLNIVVETNESETIEMVVRNDNVEKTVLSSGTHYTHRLSLGNPAIELQQRTCDNFSMTYILEDVTLAYDNIKQGVMSPLTKHFGRDGSFSKDSRLSTGNYKWQFEETGGLGLTYKIYEVNIEKQKTIFTREQVFTKQGTLLLRNPISTDGYEDVKGFCKSATIEEIREADYSLVPGRYVGIDDSDKMSDEEVKAEIIRVKQELKELMEQGKVLDEKIYAILNSED
jgi:hypothetical protein